jgi:hypothetical protein
MVEVKFTCSKDGESMEFNFSFDDSKRSNSDIRSISKAILSFDTYTVSIGDDFRIVGKLTDTVAHRQASANIFENTCRTLCESL